MSRSTSIADVQAIKCTLALCADTEDRYSR